MAATPPPSGGTPNARLLVNAFELLRQSGSRRHVSHVVEAADIDAEHPAITGPLAVEFDLESTVDDVGVTGTIDIPWHGECRRCLRPLDGVRHVDVDERYAEMPGGESDALVILRGQIDLRATVRDEVLLALEDDPLCRPDCPGLCPVCGRLVADGSCSCDTGVVDDRWAALDDLRD